jgi:hypothetical protein
MSLQLMKDLRSALANLNPSQVRESAERPIRVALAADSPEVLVAMEDFLVPASVSHEKRMEAMETLYREGDPGAPEHFDLVLHEENLDLAETNAFPFYARNPQQTVEEILAERSDLGLALARNFVPFRRPVVDRIVNSIARENALFAVATALPNFVPSIFELPWAAGEFASDTVVLTMNQIRMAFLIAAASDNEVGYREQKAQIASIITGAFGWRTLARELVGKIPFGGGVIPKGAIAWAGTYVVGLSLERYHRLGYGLSRAERKEAYQAALERGKSVVEALLEGFKKGAQRIHA